MNLIEEIKARVSIREVLAVLNIPVKHGFILSPYRPEKSPSCKIYEATNSYYDYSSNQGGDVIDLWCAVNAIDKATSIKELIRYAGLSGYQAEGSQVIREAAKPIEEEKFQEGPKHGIIGLLSQDEQEAYYERLGMGDEREAARHVKMIRLKKNVSIFKEFESYCRKAGWDMRAFNYMTKIRKMPDELVEDYFFCVSNYMQVNNHMKKEFTIEDLRRSGLFNLKGNLIFAFHRIVIPYRLSGHQVIRLSDMEPDKANENVPVYLRARYFDGAGKSSEEKASKYTSLKDDGLGVNSARRFYWPLSRVSDYQGDAHNASIQVNGMTKRLYITEGEFDAAVIRGLLRYNAVAIPGVGNLPEIGKFKKLMEFECLACVDNDSAGKKLLNGHYIDARGAKRYSENNLTAIFKNYGKTLGVKVIPQKDVNDWVAEMTKE